MNLDIPASVADITSPVPTLTNGTHAPAMTVLECIQRNTNYFNPTYWKEKLMQCHVPYGAPAEEWESGIARCAMVFYKAGEGAV